MLQEKKPKQINKTKLKCPASSVQLDDPSLMLPAAKPASYSLPGQDGLPRSLPALLTPVLLMSLRPCNNCFVPVSPGAFKVVVKAPVARPPLKSPLAAIRLLRLGKAWKHLAALCHVHCARGIQMMGEFWTTSSVCLPFPLCFAQDGM